MKRKYSHIKMRKIIFITAFKNTQKIFWACASRRCHLLETLWAGPSQLLS